MNFTAKGLLLGTLLFLANRMDLSAQSERPITSKDCVETRYFSDDHVAAAIQINPQSTFVAYIVKSPNLQKNRNDFELYVRSLQTSPNDTERKLISAPQMSGMRWLADGKHIVVLAQVHQHVSVVEVDVETASYQELAAPDEDIVEYTIDKAARDLVFATEVPHGVSLNGPSPLEVESGYRINLEPLTGSIYYKRRLFATHLLPNGHWTAAQNLIIRSPSSNRPLTVLPYAVSLRLSLSPDGGTLLFSYVTAEDKLPEGWNRSSFVEQLLKVGTAPSVVVMLDLASSRTTIPITTPLALTVPMWSVDGSSFITIGASPVGSLWEKRDIGSNAGLSGAFHVFWTNAKDAHTELVVNSVARLDEEPLAWRSDGALYLHTADTSISRLEHQGDAWKAMSETRFPSVKDAKLAHLASDGIYVVGDHQTRMSPPALFIYRSDWPAIRILSRLNPQFDHLNFARPQDFHWTPATGYELTGTLLMPPDYDRSRRYPLVIQTKPDDGGFLCDSGENHYPSFAPQPIADTGIIYLTRTDPDNYSKRDDESHYPRGYPGGIGEAAFQMEMWDSAVTALDQTKIIDPKKVGIIGFSRSGWYVAFMLAHAKTHYAAATITDNVSYGMGEYWLAHSTAAFQSFDAMYAGPPYGPTLKNWLDYSTSFNLDKIHTPILMEKMGYGTPYANQFAPPISLVVEYEMFAGLSRLGNPVELYYYPNEEHQPDRPLARLATLQRNVDWYRFWLQGYERPSPGDPDQYKRWEHLRDLRDTNLRSAPSSADSRPN
jgi:dipeptidyl aminopeptidase/acylaminoacyl peptidase